jgi:uncharacterized delta-60 repeat protein
MNRVKRQKTRHRAIKAALGAAIVCAVFQLASIAEARVGALDPSFGVGGRVTTQLRPGESGQMVVGPDGKVLLNRGRLLTRYLPNGELDPDFGEGGRLSLERLYAEKLEGLDLLPGPIALDSKGRMVVFGGAVDPERRFDEPLRLLGAPASWVVVLRLTPNGQLDKSFGGGKGFIRSDFGIGSDFETDIPLVEEAGGRVDSQDRPVILVTSAALTGRCDYAKVAIVGHPRAVVRLTEDGSMDTTFGRGDGISPVDGVEWFPALDLDGSGQPIVAVPTENCKKGGNRIFRLGTDGQPLAGFGSEGSRYYPGLYFSAIEPGGQLILQHAEIRAAEPARTEAVARTNTGGTLDPSFGEDGIALVTMPEGANRRLKPVGADAQGRIILVGSLSLPAARKHPKRRAAHHRKKRSRSRSYLLVTRLTAHGKTDLSFGKRGWIMTRLPQPQHPQVVQAALDLQGRLVVEVGSNDARQRPGSRIVLARYLLNG